MAVFQAKVPAVLAASIICLFVGGGLGAAIMSYVVGGPNVPQASASPGEAGASPKGGGSKAGPKGGGGAKGGKAGGGGGGGGQRGPSSKMQLAQLVNRLDTLTKQSLHVELTAEQKKQTKDLLAGLETKDEITDEDAKAKLEALLKLLESQRATLEAAGYRWPGGGGGGAGGPGAGGGAGGGGPPPNPFKTGDNADRLKSLQETLGK